MHNVWFKITNEAINNAVLVCMWNIIGFLDVFLHVCEI